MYFDILTINPNRTSHDIQVIPPGVERDDLRSVFIVIVIDSWLAGLPFNSSTHLEIIKIIEILISTPFVC